MFSNKYCTTHSRFSEIQPAAQTSSHFSYSYDRASRAVRRFQQEKSSSFGDSTAPESVTHNNRSLSLHSLCRDRVTTGDDLHCCYELASQPARREQECEVISHHNQRDYRYLTQALGHIRQHFNLTSNHLFYNRRMANYTSRMSATFSIVGALQGLDRDPAPPKPGESGSGESLCYFSSLLSLSPQACGHLQEFQHRV